MATESVVTESVAAQSATVAVAAAAAAATAASHSAFQAWKGAPVSTASAQAFLDDEDHEKSQLQADSSSTGEACIFFALASLAVIFTWLDADALIDAHGSVMTMFLAQLLSAMLHLAADGIDTEQLEFVVYYVTALHSTDLLTLNPRALRALASRIKDFGTRNNHSNVALFAASAATYMVIEAFKKLSLKCGLNADQIEGLWTIALSMQLFQSTPQGNTPFPLIKMIVGKPKEAQRRGDERTLLANCGRTLYEFLYNCLLAEKKDNISSTCEASRANAHKKKQGTPH